MYVNNIHIQIIIYNMNDNYINERKELRVNKYNSDERIKMCKENELKNQNEENLYPATWEKYHCVELINDVMKCIACREVLYVTSKCDTLYCISCKFEAKPSDIDWICIICTKEFSSLAQVYNANNYIMIKNSIKEAIENKNYARPSRTPCCKINLMQNKIKFLHKNICKGYLLLGHYNNEKILVCEICKTMNYFNKYNWTCPNCRVNFKENIAPSLPLEIPIPEEKKYLNIKIQY